MKQLSVMIPDDVMDEIEKQVARMGNTKSIVVRDMLRASARKYKPETIKMITQVVQEAITVHERHYHSMEPEPEKSL